MPVCHGPIVKCGNCTPVNATISKPVKKFGLFSHISAVIVQKTLVFANFVKHVPVCHGPIDKCGKCTSIKFIERAKNVDLKILELKKSK